MKPGALLLVFLLLGSKVIAQTTEKFTPVLMEAKFGAKLIYTSEAHSITLDIVSKKIALTGNPNLINVDSKPFQFVLLPNSALSITDTILERQKAELLGYVKYEVDYVKNDLKLKISGVTSSWLIINNKLFIFWYYNMPPDNKSVLQQINLSTLCFAHVLNLNNPVTLNEKVDTNKQLLVNVAQTLKLNNFKIDLKAMYKELQDQMKQ